jgi:hypothetical protein
MSPFRSAMIATLLCTLSGAAPLVASAAIAQETLIRIGDAVGAVQAALHTTIEPVPQTGPGPTRTLRLPSRGLWVFFNASNQSYTVRFDAPFSGSVSGIRIGASRDDLIAKLGQPNKVITTFVLPGIRTQPYLYTLASGTTIRFDFDGSDTVRMILVTGGVARFIEGDPETSSGATASTAAIPNETQQFLALVTTYRGKAFCAPSTATIGDAIKVVSQSVKSHPEWQGRYSDQQALQALADAYPCTVSLDTPISQLGGRKLLTRPSGEYATIDTKADIEVIEQLHSGAPTENADLAAQVTRTSGRYSPPVLFALAEWYYMRGQVDDALFWLNAAGLRGRFDAKICTDTSAQSAIAELSQRLPPDLYREQWKDPARIKTIVDRVIDWDAKTPADYDHRWISLHGLKAINSGLGMSVPPEPLTLPQTQWRDIEEKNRQSYRADMYRYASGDRESSGSKKYQ